MSNVYGPPNILHSGEIIDPDGLSIEVVERIGVSNKFDFNQDPDYLATQAQSAQVYKSSFANEQSVIVKTYEAPMNNAMSPPTEIEYLAEFGDNPHFPQFITSGRHKCFDMKTRAYVATEFLVKGTLLDANRGRTETTVTDRLQVVADVAGALAILHDQGLVHGDVNPSNTGIKTVYGENGSVRGVLLDLVTVRPIGTPNPGIFTPKYADPKVECGVDMLPSHDVCSLGKTLEVVPVGDELAERRAQAVELMTQPQRPDMNEAQSMIRELVELSRAA